MLNQEIKTDFTVAADRHIHEAVALIWTLANI
jgi:hypothetical protein